MSRCPVWARLAGLTAIVIWLLGILPPFLEELGISGPASVIRHSYRLLCHGIPDRSPMFFGRNAAVCYRCTSIYLSLAAGCLILFPVLRYRLTLSQAVGCAIILTLLMGLQWLMELLSLIHPSTFLRVLTGALWGLGMGILLCISLDIISGDHSDSGN